VEQKKLTNFDGNTCKKTNINNIKVKVNSVVPAKLIKAVPVKPNNEVSTNPNKVVSVEPNINNVPEYISDVIPDWWSDAVLDWSPDQNPDWSSELEIPNFNKKRVAKHKCDEKVTILNMLVMRSAQVTATMNSNNYLKVQHKHTITHKNSSIIKFIIR
jgi:hypothetical protein